MIKQILISIVLVFLCCLNAFAQLGKWDEPTNIKTYIPPNHPRTQMMKHAFEEWSRLTKDKIVFRYVKDKKQAQLEIIFTDKINDSKSDKSIGLTKGLSNSSGKMVHATVWIAAKTQDGRTLNNDEVYTVMLHEVGHAIGLEHSNNPKSALYPQLDIIQEVDKSDLVTLSKKYGWKLK